MEALLGELPIKITQVQREQRILSDRRVMQGELGAVGHGWGGGVWVGEHREPGKCEDTECADRVGVRGLQADTEQLEEGVRAASRKAFHSGRRITGFI